MSGVLDVLAGATGAPPPEFGSTGSSLYVWGDNSFGGLGLGNTINYFSPKQVGSETNWSTIDGGYTHSIGIKTDGTLWSWGYVNANGQLGLGNTTAYSSPKQVGGMTNWLNVACGFYHTLATTVEGKLYSWGGNNYGQLGLGNNTVYSSPKQVGALTNWLNVACGYYHSIGIKTDGTLWSWGFNAYGNLGLGNTTNSPSPKQVGALTTWYKIAGGGYSSLGLKLDGTLWSWGYNTSGQLGLGNITSYSSPKQVGSLTTWLNADLGTHYALGLKTDGTMWLWGANNYGQLGLGNTTNYSVPKQVGSETNWSKISCGYNWAICIKTDGSLWAWGKNAQGQLGLGNNTGYSSPKQVGALTNWSKIAANVVNTFALTATKTVPDKPTNVSAVAGDTNATVTFTAPSNGGSPITSYTVTAYTGGVSTGITTSGVTTSITITGLTNGTAYTFTVKATNAIGTGKESDTSAVVYGKGLWSWGRNVQGNLGLGNTTYYSSPKAVGALTDWSNISTGSYHVLAIKTNGTLWSWGFNAYGGLGLGNTTYYSSPKQVGALTNWLKVTAGYRHSIGIKTDGSIWSWGGNTAGQLGLGNTTNYSSPKQVGALTTWLQVACGYYYTSAIKTDGTLWTWGRNLQGQLGLGDTTQRNSPVQVGSDSNWSKITSGVYSNNVIKTDGTLWTWGFNSDGQLGLGDTTNRSSPNQVGSGTTWSSISSKHAHCIATKIDGTLWAWGNGGSGQLGLGSLISYSSPKQVGSDTNWSNVASGGAHSIALKTNGTLWSWGRNSQGQLGLGDTTNRSSPNQVGALTTWSFISSDTNYALAFQNASNNAVTPSTRSFVDDVFSTYLYTGNGSTQTITNGIDLAGNGGMVWTKRRSANADSNRYHVLIDTARGGNYSIFSNSTQGSALNNYISSFNSDGYTLSGTDQYVNGNTPSPPYTYASWTFRKAAKFFDVVTFTGNGTSNRAIPHSLGIAPGMVIVKATNQNDNWTVWHNYNVNKFGILNLTSQFYDDNGTTFGGTSFPPTSSSFYINSALNQSGFTYVAYLFAHDTSSTGIIQCGSFTTDAANGNATVNLGWEPQYCLMKAANISQSWRLLDTMRGWSLSGGDLPLFPDLSDAEGNFGSVGSPTATGFTINSFNASQTYIYMAIRRPNKPPTSGTQVYNAITRTGTGAVATVTGVGFAPDLVTGGTRSGNYYFSMFDRLRGSLMQIDVGSSHVETSTAGSIVSFDMNGYSTALDNNGSYGGTINDNGGSKVNYFFKRAPGFFDEVCYTGIGAGVTNVSHNLTVVPELIMIKKRSTVGDWYVSFNMALSTYTTAYLNVTNSAIVRPYADGFMAAAPTSNTFTLTNQTGVNFPDSTYVAYLFATLAGISKVGSYTGNGGTLTVNCGFTAGARFVLIKRTNSTGDWYVWDTARSINPGNEPHLSLNTAAAEVTTDDTMDYDTNGFVVNQVADTNVNVTSATYIYLAIA